MKKVAPVIVYAIIIFVLVGAIVFLVGNNQPSPMNNNSSTISSQTTIIQAVNSTVKISSANLTKHNLKSDCWVGYKGKVYDLTAWLPKHPGSSAAIEPYCGNSTEFEKAFSGKHGTSQVGTLLKESIYKGDLE